MICSEAENDLQEEYESEEGRVEAGHPGGFSASK